MRIRKAAPIIGAILVPILLFALAGSVVAGPLWPWSDIPNIQGEVISAAIMDSEINYQGRLTNSGGNPLTGSYDMVFQLWDSESMTTQVGSDISVSGVAVADGLFNVKIPVTQSWFNGQALWLRVKVGADNWMTPLQEILPVPYALSLRPGADIEGTESGTTLEVMNTATGSAVLGASGTGVGVYGYSEDNYAVLGIDAGTGIARGYGGYFASSNGVGVYGYSSAQSYYTNMYTPGVYGRSANGIGVYGLSDSDSSGVLGQSTDGIGVRGWSENAYGVYGYSENDYGGYFYSYDYRGIYASSPSSWYAGWFENRGGSTSPGLRVEGTLLTTGSKTGYVVDICLNEGPEPLETGDVVVVTGFSQPVNGEIPVIRVRKATEAESTGVVGVVDQPFMVETSPDDGNSVPKPMAGTALIASGTAISPGEYLSVVTLGSFKAIKVDASYGAIRPGDLLVSSPNPGYAMKAAAPQPGTIIGKALGSLGSGTGTIPVLVTLQ